MTIADRAIFGKRPLCCSFELRFLVPGPKKIEDALPKSSLGVLGVVHTPPILRVPSQNLHPISAQIPSVAMVDILVWQRGGTVKF